MLLPDKKLFVCTYTRRSKGNKKKPVRQISIPINGRTKADSCESSVGRTSSKIWLYLKSESPLVVRNLITAAIA